jgi:uncharacterized protein (DUF433 family)
MVWLLVLLRRGGKADAELLADYPTLTPDDLDAAWDYFRRNPVEIEQSIWLSVTALDHPPGTPVPPGELIQARLLGLSDEQIRSAYDPPLEQADLDAAWEAYRRDPKAIDRQIADSRSVA